MKQQFHRHGAGRSFEMVKKFSISSWAAIAGIVTAISGLAGWKYGLSGVAYIAVQVLAPFAALKTLISPTLLNASLVAVILLINMLIGAWFAVAFTALLATVQLAYFLYVRLRSRRLQSDLEKIGRD